MAIETLILIGIGIYVLIMMAIAVYASRGSKSLADFALAGRKMPLWLCTVSVFATWFGSGTMMGATTAAYELDRLDMLAEPFGSALALLLIGLFFIRILRRTRRMTWPETVHARFGKLAGTIAAAVDWFSSIIWLGGILFTFGVLLQSLTGTPFNVGVIIGLVVVVSYTMIGGMWAVAITDFVQMIIFVVGLFILLGVVMYEAGGVAAVTAPLPAGAMNVVPPDATAMDWIDTIHVFMAMGLAAVASTSVVQRGLSARNEKVAQNSFYIAAISYAIIGSVPLLLGFAARVLLPDLDNPNAALNELAVEFLHPVLAALFIGSILSAIMSSSDSILLGTSTIASTNFLPLVKSNPSEELRFKVTRYSIPFGAAVSTYIAFNSNRVIDVLMDSVAVILAMVLVPFIACFYWNKANRSGALASMITGAIAWGVADSMGMTFPPDLFGFCVGAVVIVVVSLATQKLDPPHPLTDIDGEVVQLKGRS